MIEEFVAGFGNSGVLIVDAFLKAGMEHLPKSFRARSHFRLILLVAGPKRKAITIKKSFEKLVFDEEKN